MDIVDPIEEDDRVKDIMKRKRQVRSQIRNAKPSERPDPFKPP